MEKEFSDANSGQTVLVTGGSGYVGTWAIATLLQQGYRVRTTVRSLEREPAVCAAVAETVDPENRLAFFVANLLSDEGWDQAAEGAHFILHIASPMPAGEFKGQDVIRPAREGTLRVLKAGAKAGAKHVVMTSSTVAAQPAAGAAGGLLTDEAVWTDTSSKPTTDFAQYAQAKTLAEQDAWGFVKGLGGQITLATILAASVQGPVLGKDYSASVDLIARLLEGHVPAIPRMGFSVVDVRDLVGLHLRAMTAPEAAGQRFVASGDFLWMADIAQLLRDRLGSRAAQVTTRLAPDVLVRFAGLFDSDARQIGPLLGAKHEYSAAKAETLLGWRPRPASETVVDTAESLISHGLV